MAFVQSVSASFFGTPLNSPPIRKCQLRRRPAKYVVRSSIEQEVSQKLKEAMKKKDTAALKALRGIRAAFLNASKKGGAGNELPDSVAMEQLRKLAKMRRESIVMFRKGNRDDLADGEQAELQIIEEWLPKLATRDQTIVWAKEAIQKVSASGPGDMGKVMGAIMGEHKQEVDGNLLKDIVKELLA